MDIFFAMSGFLITSLLVMEYRQSRDRSAKDEGSISLTRFYERRARRILPAALFVNACVLVGSYFIFNHIRFAEARPGALWSALWVENYHLISTQANYFAQGVAESPYQHYWSLAVEEQFYLFWPVIFLVAIKLKFLSRIPKITEWRERLLLAIVLIAIPSVIISWVSANADPAAAYYSTINRAWIILLGAAAAIAPWLRNGVGDRTAKAASWGGAALIVIGIYATPYGTPYPGLIALFPALGTTMLMVAGIRARASTPVTGFLESKPVRFTGRISYSLYLWHWPIIIFAGVLLSRETLSGWPRFFFLGTVCVLISWASARFIELPFHQVRKKTAAVRDQHGRWIGTGRQKAQLAAMAFVAVATISVIGLGARPTAEADSAVALAAAKSSAAERPAPSDSAGTAARWSPSAERESWRRTIAKAAGQSNTTQLAIDIAGIGASKGPAYVCGQNRNLRESVDCSVGGGGTGQLRWPRGLPPRAVLIGSSIGSQWRLPIALLMPTGTRLYPLSTISCDPTASRNDHWRSPGSPDCGDHVAMTDSAIAKLRPGLAIVALGGGISPTDAGSWQQSVSRTSALIERLRRTVPRVLVISPAPPLVPFDTCLQRDSTNITACNRQQYPILTEREGEIADVVRAAGATYLSGPAMFCHKGTCPAFARDRPLRYDGAHLTERSMDSARGFVQQALARALG